MYRKRQFPKCQFTAWKGSPEPSGLGKHTLALMLAKCSVYKHRTSFPSLLLCERDKDNPLIDLKNKLLISKSHWGEGDHLDALRALNTGKKPSRQNQIGMGFYRHPLGLSVTLIS